MTRGPKPKLFKRPCTRCGKKFHPATKHTKLCDECHFNAMRTNRRNGGNKK